MKLQAVLIPEPVERWNVPSYSLGIDSPPSTRITVPVA
jgi:hypothetical protein